MNLTEVNHTDLCSQFSCPERSVSALYVFLYVCGAAVVLLTVFGNLLVIISVYILVGVFVLPFQLSRLTESCWIFGSVLCTCYMLISFFSTSSSIYNVAIIAVDRYFAISHPFVYTEKVSVNTACIVALSNWFLLICYNSSLLYFNGSSTGLIMCPEQCLFVINEVWSLVDLLFVFVIPCSLIILFYALVFCIAKKHATAIRDLNTQTKHQASNSAVDSMKSERKAAKVLSILVVVFLACLFPYFVYVLVGTGTILAEYLMLLLYLNSSINPVIYALFYPWFRKCTKVILTLQILSNDSVFINVR
uniref:G-protein coupled receptors family 1 profile domain-containing protein n=1 Tax=Astyanax mexicanus TaxID=7994 RepID=A0A3B1J9S6_ASTMX